MKKNKIVTLLAAFLCCFLLLSGCGDFSQNTENEKISIVCTTFPQYDWAREVIGKNASRFELTLLLDSGIDLHSYQPTVEDISLINNADIFIYVGGESDKWTQDVLEEATNPNLQAINLLEVLGDKAKAEETIEGMQESEHHHDEHDEHSEHEYDEHIWLSLRNANLLISAISQKIIESDPDNTTTYRDNTEQYLKKLHELDEQYTQMVASAKYDTLLFGDRFPFRYLMDDYDLHYYAAFSGCSAESEASFETITFLAQKMDELKLPAILVLENSNTQIADTIKQNTQDGNQKILVLNSIQSVTNTDIENHFTYLDAMQKNLETLTQALPK